MKRVYIETTIVSYLTARPSRDVVIAGHQEVTRQWWNTSRHSYELFVSRLVLDEVRRGDAEAAERRLSSIAGLPFVLAGPETGPLTRSLLRQHALPLEAEADALHVALAATNRMDYLLTWNLAHIANAQRLWLIAETIRRHGFDPPIICTPDEMLGGLYEE
jgi:predicted nucleic acid-binding protein